MSSADHIRSLPPHPAAKARLQGRRSGGRLRSTFEIIWAGMLIAAVCIAGMVALSWFQSQGAVAIVRQQASEIREGKLDQAYDLFSSEYRSGTTLPMFRRWLRRQPTFASIQRLHIWGRSVWRGTAILWGSFEDEFGHSYPVRYSLVRENGGWRIDRFDVPEDLPESLPNTQRFQYN